MKDPKVYILVLNYNGWKDTIACLESLLNLNYNNYRILVLDNASTNNSEEKILEWMHLKNSDLIDYIQVGKNKGFAGGNNVGLRLALNDSEMKYAWVLNNDTIVDSNALQELVSVMESDSQIGICGSKLIFEWDRSRIQGYGARYNRYTGIPSTILEPGQIESMDYVIGASMLISRPFLQEIGMMNEEYFLYYEELDWILRAKEKYRIACAPDCIVYHKEGAAIGADAVHIGQKSELSDYYSIRNRILFTKKYYPWCLPTVYLGLCWAIINRMRRNQWTRIGMIIRLMLGRYDKKYEK